MYMIASYFMYTRREKLTEKLSDFFLIKHVFLYEKTKRLVRSKCNLEKTRKLDEPFIERKRIKKNDFVYFNPITKLPVYFNPITNLP